MLGAWERGAGLVERVARIAGGAVRRSGPLIVFADDRLAAVDPDETWAVVEGEIHDGEAPPAVLFERAFDRDGAACFESLEGSFAAVVWDARRHTAILGCDALGLGRLYVWESAGGLVFATSVPELLEVLARRPEVDREAAASWLERAALPADRTVMAGVRRLPPGELLELSVDGVHARRQTRPRLEPRVARDADADADADANANADANADDAAAQVRAALARSLRRRCDGPQTALLLSGGLDSSALAATAVAELEPARLPTVHSLLFPGEPAQHEARWIDLVTRALGLSSVRMAVTGGSVVRGMLEWTRTRGLPLAAPNYFYQRVLLARMAADGITAVLDGEGGDELFANPRFLVADRLRAGRPLAAWRQVRSFPGAGAAPRRRVARVLWRYGVRGALPYPVHRAVAGRGASSFDAEWDWQATPGPRWAAHARHQVTDGFAAVGAHEHFSGRAAAAGLRARHPLRDLDLTELVLRLPPELHFDPRFNRPLLRRAVRGLLPQAVVERTDKAPFDGLVIRVMSGDDLPLLRRLLDPREARVGAVGGTGGVAPAGLLARAAEPAGHPGGLRGWADETFRLASMECWLRWLEDPSFPVRALDEWRPAETSARFDQVPPPGT